MGKIIFSTAGRFDSILDKSHKQGFLSNKLIQKPSFFAANFYKKKRKIENAYLKGDDFCISSGTLIYQDKTGVEALSGILHSFDGNVDKIRKNIIGNYCIIIRKNCKVTIFVDKYDIYKIFYQIKGNQLFMSSDIADVMFFFNNTEISEFNLMLDSFQCAPLGEDTFIEGVKRLQGRQAIEVELTTGKIDIKKIPYYRNRQKFNSLDDAAKSMASTISSAYKSVEKAFGNDVGINMTGGLDSRVILGGCLSAGISPKLLHAQGNSRLITGTELGDYNCVHKIANILGLSVYDMCWNCNYPENLSEWDRLFSKYSFYDKFYGGNPNFFDSYESLGNSMPMLLETGLFGEIMRIREKYNSTTKPFANLHAFMQEYQHRGTNSGFIVNSTFYKKSQECQDYFEKRYEEEMKSFSFDPDGPITMDEFEEVRYIHHRPTDAGLINFLNQYTGCMSVLSTEQVCETLYDSKQEYRAYATLQLKIIENLDKNLLNIPFFSHCSECVFNEKKNSLVTKLSYNEKVGAFLRKHGLKDSFFYKCMRELKYKLLKSDWKIQRTIERSKEIDSILPSLISSIDKNQRDLGKFVNTRNIPEDDSIVHLMYYALNLHGINTIRKQIEKVS